MKPLFILCITFLLLGTTQADDVKTTDVYRRIRAAIDAVPAIDTHDHLRPFELREADAIRIGRQIMRENALKLFPKLRRHLWKSPNPQVK